MYKLIIADDEKQTREGIAFFIQNNPCGFEVVGVAEGGLSALSMAMEHEPDLVLTDIRMPDLNGFALTERLAALSKKPSILIMSAYDDVEYFKTAFKVNALDYILKPIDTNELLTVMEKVKKHLDSEGEEYQKKEEMRKHMQNNLPVLRTRFLVDLVDGFSLYSPEVEDRMDFLKISLPKAGYYCTTSVSIDNKLAIYSNMNRPAEKKLAFGIQLLLEELLESHTEGYVFEYDRGEFVLLLKDEFSLDPQHLILFQNQVEILAETLFGVLKKSSISATVGIGDCVNDLSKLPQSFQKARENVRKRLVLGNNRVIQNHEYEILEDDMLFQSLNEVRAMIAVSDTNLLEKAIERYFQSVAASPKLDVLYGIQCAGMLMTAMVESLSALNCDLKIDQKDVLLEYEKLGKTETIPDMMQETMNFCIRLNQLIRGKVVDQNSDIVDKIKELIQKGYQENITIQWVADQVYLSPNYICSIFKQVTGDTLNQYITHIRIEAAKTLLEDSGIRLADIGNLVGYIEPSYFSKIFKRYTALTPKEYRQMLIGMRKMKGAL